MVIYWFGMVEALDSAGLDVAIASGWPQDVECLQRTRTPTHTTPAPAPTPTTTPTHTETHTPTTTPTTTETHTPTHTQTPNNHLTAAVAAAETERAAV